MPCLHGYAKMGAMKTMAEVGLALLGAGCSVATAVISPSDIVMARNFLAGTAVAEGYTHLFLLDSEMMFPARLAARMFAADKDVIGLIHAHPALDLRSVIRTARADEQLTPEVVASKVQRYVLRLTEPTSFSGGMGKVSGVGTGALLVRTAALKALIDTGRARAYPPLPSLVGPAMPHWGFFDPIEAAEGETLTDGFALCARWTAAGGEVWALAAPNVNRVGDFDFVGDILAN